MGLVVLLQASPQTADGSKYVGVRLAGGGSRPYVDYLGFSDWRSGVQGLPRFTTELGFDQSGWTGGALPQSAVVRFMGSDKALMSTLAGLYWKGARVVISSGDDTFGPPAAWALEMTGTIADVSFVDGALQLTMADLAGDLGKPAAPDTFAGNGGIEGGDDASGRMKRRSWGAVWNVEARLLDKANNIYEIGDPARPLQAIASVKDKGRAGDVTVLPWQGSVALTFQALQAAAAPSGGAVAAPSIACVKWWTVPSGPLTADFQGETAGGYTDQPTMIAQRVVAAAGVAGIGFGAVVARAYQCGLHIDDANETLASALDRLLLPVSLIWSLSPAGLITITEWTWTGPVETLISQQVDRETVFAPLLRRKLGFQRNQREQSDSEISSVLLLATDATYADGTPIEVLKPAQANADSTAQNTAAAITGQGAFATVSQAAYGSPLLTGFGQLSPLSSINFGSQFLLEGPGGVQATIAAFKTALGSAASFFGQGALATLSNLANGSQYLTGFGGLSALTDVIIGAARGGAYGLLTQNGFATSDGALITNQGTAAAFFGQGALATRAAVRLGQSTDLLGALVDENNNFIVTNALAITQLGTAAAFQGQGALATLSSLANGSQYLSGFGLLSQRSYIKIGGPSIGGDSFALLTEEGGATSNNTVLTSLGTAAAIFGQGFGATAAQNLVDNSYVPVGVNTQLDSGFTRTTATWFVVGGTSPVYNLEFNRADYSGKRSVAYLWSNTTPPADEIVDAVGLGKWTSRPATDMRKYSLPVKLGDVVAGRVLAGNHRSNASLYLLVFDKDGGLLFAPFTNVGATPGGGGGGDNFGEMSLTVAISQPSAAYAQLMIRMTTTGEANPYLFFSEPWIGKLASINSPIPPYSPGPADPTSDKTGTNTAAAFLGQGALATLSSLANGSQYLSGFGGLAALTDVIIGAPRGGAYGLLTQNGFGTSDASLITSQGTSAAFYGQAALATLSYVKLGATDAAGAGLVTQNGFGTSDASLITSQGSAASFAGQGALATRNAVRLGASTGELGALVDENNNFFVTNAAAITSQGTAAAFAGQGALATKSSIGSDADLSGQIANRLAPSPVDANYLAAGRVAWAIGDTLENYKPGEPGANKTETRTAAAFTGQSSWATYTGLVPTTVAGQVSKIDGNGNLTASGVVLPGVAFLSDRFPAEAGANVTEIRTAAAVTSQGSLATQDIVRLGSPSGRLGGLVSENNVFYVTDTVAVTSYGTAAAFAGQGSLATRNGVTYGDGYTFGFNYLATQTSVSLNTTTIRRADGSTSLSETLVVTEQGTAAAFYGQGGLSTRNDVGFDQIQIESLRRQDTDIDNTSYQSTGYGQAVFATGLVATVTGVRNSGDLYVSINCTIALTAVGGGGVAGDSYAFVRLTYPNGAVDDRSIPYSGIVEFVAPSTQNGTITATAYVRRGTTNLPPEQGSLGQQSPYIAISNSTLKVVWRAI